MSQQFLKLQGEQILADVTAISLTNMTAGRSPVSRETMYDAVLYISSKMLYSNVVKAYIEPMLIGDFGSPYQSLAKDVIELLVVSVQIYITEVYLLGRQTSVSSLMLETFVANALSDNIQKSIAF